MKSRRTGEMPYREFTAEERADWYLEVLAIYGEMAAHPCPYEFDLDGVSLTVLRDVYSPCYFTDTFWFAQVLPAVVGRASLLEIGCGTGVLSIVCARQGARVIATDVNPAAVTNSRVNAKRAGVDLVVLEGNVYEPVRPEAKFDFLFWAHPFNNPQYPVSDMLLRSGFDQNYSALQEYISGAQNWLGPGGRLLLGTGDTADLRTVVHFAADCGYSPMVLAESEMPLGRRCDGRVRYMLVELSRAF